MTRQLRDKVVVVTGASSGIGRAAAHAFARRRARVVLAARRKTALKDVADECRRDGGHGLPIPTDVADPAAVDTLARRAVETFGRLDVWVNNAGVALFGRTEEVPLEDIRQVLDTNLMGCINGARAALPWFREQGEGVLINVGSMLSRAPAPNSSAYTVSKAGIQSLSGCLRTELHDVPGIRVCTIMPAPVDTQIWQHAANHTGYRILAPRPTLSPERVARVIVRCAQRPRREVTVGNVGRASILASMLLPGLTERAIAWQMPQQLFAREDAPPSPGNLRAPLPEDAAVTGGWRGGHRSRAQWGR